MSGGVFRLTGLVQAVIGTFLFAVMAVSLWNPETVLSQLVPSSVRIDVVSCNAWQQTSVGFGMHAFADIYNGIEQALYATSSPRHSLSPTVSVWNSTRFIISFMWAVKLLEGLAYLNDLRPGAVVDVLSWKPLSLALIAVLLFDSLVLRPVSVLMQRRVLDANPPLVNAQLNEQNALSGVERACRGVFYYESVLSGTSGIVYMITPQLYLWLYDFPGEQENFLALWSLSQFGILVTAFGLYQMSAEIDTRSALVAWWLFLDLVWLYVFVDGVRTVRDQTFNPLTLVGGNFWHHAAFHADSTLALARAIFLLSVMVRGRDKQKLE